MTSIQHANVLDCYESWPNPTVIVSDGPYGLGIYPNEPKSPLDLPAWYEPHVAAWTKAATPLTTLWFWCNEIGWATVHPLLEAHGWVYSGLHVWDKGIGHIAGNVNSKTIRSFPMVSEVCVRYVRGNDLPDAEPWETTQAKWRHQYGITNVWPHPTVRGEERIKDRYGKTLHPNQKPLALIERTILASSDPGDVIWEPFGGLCPAAVVSDRQGRDSYSAEVNARFHAAAVSRLEREKAGVV